MIDYAKVKAAYDKSPFGVVLCEGVYEDDCIVDLMLVYMNPAAGRIWRTRPDKIAGKRFTTLGVDKSGQMRQAYEYTIATGEKKSIDYFGQLAGRDFKLDFFPYDEKVAGFFVENVNLGLSIPKTIDETLDETLDNRSMTELEKRLAHFCEQYGVFDDEDNNVEEKNDFICYSDIDTHEIIKLTALGENSIAQAFDEDYVGQKCYEVLQHRNSPCPLCSNRHLFRDRYHIWQNHNAAANKDYLHKTKLVKIDDRYARMDITQDITDDSRKAMLLSNMLEGMSVWNGCTRILRGDVSLQKSIETTLETLGTYYRASSGVILLFGPTKYSAVWTAGDSYEMSPFFEDPTQEALDTWGALFLNKTHLRISDTTGSQLPEELRDFFESRSITSVQLSPIFIGSNLKGILCLNNVSHNKSQMYFADMVAQAVASSFEQTEIREAMNKMQFHDPLTGCLNLAGFKYMAEFLIRENPDKDYLLEYADIRRFKYINDMFGYETGDGFLKYFAKAIEADTRENEVFCRISADNFARLHWSSGEKESKARFEGIAEALTRYPGLKDRNFTPEVICGVYKLTEEDKREPDVEGMMNRANIAQKSVKGLLRSRISFYDETLRDMQLRELEISQHLEQGIENGEFFIVLQPQFNYAKKTIVGAEALVRWDHYELGSITPKEFIPLLEKAGIITILDSFVWEEVCKFLRHMLDTRDAGEIVPVSVNISRADIYLTNLVELFKGLMEKYDLPTSLLKLEITESAYLADSEQLIEMVAALRDVGFSVEMDDFGSGYSSLNVLKDVPVDALKLDMKFLTIGEDMHSGGRGGSILSSVVRMAHNINLPVVAEGVETKEQADYLASIGCYMMQGYYFARPMAISKFEELLDQYGAGGYLSHARTGNILGSEEFLSTNGATSYIFNNCIGAGVLLEYDGDDVEAILLNESFYETIELPREEVDRLRPHMLSLFLEEDRPAIRAGLDEAVEKGSSLVYARVKGSQPGSERWMRGMNRYLVSNDGKHSVFLLLEDVTEQKLAEIKLIGMEHQLRSVIELVPSGLFRYATSWDDPGFDYVNEGLLKMLGYSREAFEKKFDNNVTELVYFEDRDRVNQMRTALSAEGDVGRIDHRIETASGELRWFRDERRVVIDGDGVKWGYAILTDMGIQQPLNISQRWQAVQYHAMNEAQKSILYDYDPVKDEMTYCAIDAGSDPEELTFPRYLADKKFDRVHPDDRERYGDLLARSLKGKSSGTLEFRSNYFSQDWAWCRSSYVSLKDEEGNLTRLVGRVVDIEEEKRFQQQINRDSLTGFLNQSATRSAISAALEERQQGALFVVDIDDFKTINDTLGHLFGDSFLNEAANSLSGIFREEDMLGRIGGDEFVVFVPGALDLDVVQKKAQTILDAFSNIQVPQLGSIHVSVGVSLVEEGEYCDYASLFKRADKALYHAKKRGKNCFVIFNQNNPAMSMIAASPKPEVPAEIEMPKSEWTQTLASEVFTILYDAKTLPDGVNAALAHVGQRLEVSRVYLFELKDGRLSNTYEWCKKGVSSMKSILQDIPDGGEDGGLPYASNFDIDGIYYLRYLKDAPDWVRERLEPQGIKSMLQYAYMEDGEMVGFVGFDECAENVFWTQDQIDDLARIAQVISVFVDRGKKD